LLESLATRALISKTHPGRPCYTVPSNQPCRPSCHAMQPVSSYHPCTTSPSLVVARLDRRGERGRDRNEAHPQYITEAIIRDSPVTP
jgi:hypothetical protein